MSTSNNVQEDESFILGSNFFPEDGSSLRDQNSRLKSLETAVTGLSSQLGTILALLQRQPSPTPVDNVSPSTLTPPPRRQSDLFTVDQTDTVVPTSTGGSTIILSPQLAASKPHLEVFNLYHFIIFARSFMDWRMMGPQHSLCACRNRLARTYWKQRWLTSISRISFNSEGWKIKICYNAAMIFFSARVYTL